MNKLIFTLHQHILRNPLEATHTVWHTTLYVKMLIKRIHATRIKSDENKYTNKPRGSVRLTGPLSRGQSRNKTGSHQGFKSANLNHMTTSGLLLADKKLIQPTITYLCTTKVNNEVDLQCSNSIKIGITVNKENALNQ